jgi:hypothetical protein
MSSLSGKDPYKILTYPLSSVLTMGTDAPQIGFTYPNVGGDPLSAVVSSNIPISNAIMSGALPYYEKNTLGTATLDYLQSRNQMQRMGMIPQLNQRPVAFTPPLFSYQNAPSAKKPRNWVLWVIGGLFALVLVGLIVYFFYLRRRGRKK